MTALIEEVAGGSPRTGEGAEWQKEKGGGKMVEEDQLQRVNTTKEINQDFQHSFESINNLVTEEDINQNS